MKWTPQDVAKAQERMKGKCQCPATDPFVCAVKSGLGIRECPCRCHKVLSAAAPSKMHNKPEVCDGIRFQSQKEAAYYRDLLLRVKAGEVAYFHMQVPFRLIGGVVYRCDFMEVWTDGRIRYVDTKGYRTRGYINKKKQVEAQYPVKIEEC